MNMWQMNQRMIKKAALVMTGRCVWVRRMAGSEEDD